MRLHLFGHPLHPALVHFPIAFLFGATLLDGLHLLHVDAASTGSWYCLVVGTATAVPAMLTGLSEYTRLDERLDKRLVTTASRHMTMMFGAWMFYLIALATRTRHLAPVADPGIVSYLCTAIGLVAMIWGASLGARLVYEYGAGQMSQPREQAAPSASTSQTAIRNTAANDK